MSEQPFLDLKTTSAYKGMISLTCQSQRDVTSLKLGSCRIKTKLEVTHNYFQEEYFTRSHGWL